MSPSETDPRPPPPLRGWRLALALAALAYATALFACVLLRREGLYERDGYFHARYAQMLTERGLSREFPWTQFSVWKERFADKEFLYHVLMVPFARDETEPLAGVRVFALLLSAAVCAGLFLLLRAHRVPWALGFALLLLCAGGPFLLRLTMVRSHVLSMLLAIAGMHFLIAKNWKGAAAIGFVYAWSYTVPFVLVMFAAPFALGRGLAGEWDAKTPLAAAAGVVLGLAIHPYSPLTLETFLIYLNVLRAGLEGQGQAVELGKEIYAYRTHVFPLACPLTALGALAVLAAPWWLQARPGKGRLAMGAALAFWLMAWIGNAVSERPLTTRAFPGELWFLHVPVFALGLAGWWRGTRFKPETAGAGACFLAWFVMTLLFARFVEYSALLAALALGLMTRDLAADAAFTERFAPSRLRVLKVAAWAAMLALHVYSAWFFLGSTRRMPGPRFRGAAAWMAKHLKEGETVVNLWWDDFPELFYDGHRQRYLVGLDPTYMQRAHPEKLALLEAMRRGERPLDGALLAKTFGARYMVLRYSAARGYPELTSGAWPAVYFDKERDAAVFALRPEGR